MIVRIPVRFILIEESRLVNVVHHDIQIPIVVEIGIGRAVAIGRTVHAPGFCLIGESNAMVVRENSIGNIGGRHVTDQFQNIFPFQPALSFHNIVHVFDEVEVGVVAVIPIRHQEVFPSVIVIVCQ